MNNCQSGNAIFVRWPMRKPRPFQKQKAPQLTATSYTHWRAATPRPCMTSRIKRRARPACLSSVSPHGFNVEPRVHRASEGRFRSAHSKHPNSTQFATCVTPENECCIDAYPNSRIKLAEDISEFIPVWHKSCEPPSSFPLL